MRSYDESFAIILKKQGKLAPQYIQGAKKDLERRLALGEETSISKLLFAAGLVDADTVEEIERIMTRHAYKCAPCSHVTFLLPLQDAKNLPCELCGGPTKAFAPRPAAATPVPPAPTPVPAAPPPRPAAPVAKPAAPPPKPAAPPPRPAPAPARPAAPAAKPAAPAPAPKPPAPRPAPAVAKPAPAPKPAPEPVSEEDAAFERWPSQDPDAPSDEYQ